MREGWSCKDAAAVLGISPTKVPQAIGPAFIKVARLMVADPRRTHVELLAAMEEAMSERELELRMRMQSGRLDRSVLHPPSG